MVQHTYCSGLCFSFPQPIAASKFLTRAHSTTCNPRGRRKTHASRRNIARASAAQTEPLQSCNDCASSTSVDVEFDVKACSLREGILSIAVGKLGEKPVPPAIIPAIAEELREAEERLQPNFDLLLLRASFLGALFMKQSLNIAEYALLCSATQLPRTRAFAAGRHRLPNDDKDGATADHDSSLNANGNKATDSDAVTAGEVVAAIVPNNTQSPLARYAFRLLCDERLDLQEARALGKLLYADEAMSPIKALIAHVMRVRHETGVELAGLAQAVRDSTVRLQPLSSSGTEARYVLLSEPFDGAITWDMLSPLVARHLQAKHGLQTVLSTGVSSGPKYGPNLHGVTEALVQRARTHTSDFGMVADQAVVHAGLARWVHMRRVIVKRPAIATVEKYADACPVAARLFIASAFHPGYVAKMGEAAEAVGFPAYVIIGKGMEGCIGLGIGRRVANLLVGWQEKGADGVSYAQENFTYTYSCEGEILDDVVPPPKGEADAMATAERIERYVSSGTSGNATFDVRVSATLDALDKCIAIISDRAPDILRR